MDIEAVAVSVRAGRVGISNDARATNAWRSRCILRPIMKAIGWFLLGTFAAFAQPSPLEELIGIARQGQAAPGLKDRITKTLSPRGGTAVWGQDYLFVTDSSS